MTWVIRWGLAIESFLNIFGATGFLLFPEWCLSNVVDPTESTITTTTSVPASSATLFQAYALLVLSLTVPLLLCIREVPGVRETRIMIFRTLGVGEAFLISLLLWKATDANKSGFTTNGLIMAALNLLPALLWRIWTLFIMPGLLDGDKKLATSKKMK